MIEFTPQMVREVQELIELSAKVPHPARQLLLNAREEQEREILTTTKCACGLQKKWADMPIVDTGYIKAFDHVCTDCDLARDKDLRERAILVCLGCRKIIGRVTPHVTPRGFKFEKRKFYHIQNCPECLKDIQHTNCVEESVWIKHNAKPKTIVNHVGEKSI